ncbi:hypothetical protein [Burkholderia gladioli]|uniref:hypothetical protein n=1 Tax=Burkholderia gladioli TaxID=28095 RepID=UPI00163E4E4D|nr:hypothetical protein [Burkholderia gladioli]
MTAYAIIQHPQFENDPLSAGHELKFKRTFRTTSEFGQALREAITELHKLNDATPKLLILSTHGEGLTGTSLDTGTESVDLRTYQDYFGVLPNNLVVYLSACWGSYPSTAGAIQSGSRVPPVVGPHVDIIVDHANAFQTALLDLMDGGVPSTEVLNGLLNRFNEDATLRRNDYGNRRCIFGMWDSSGTFHPPEAPGAQLAAPVHEDGHFELIDLVRHDDSGDVIACIVINHVGEQYQANIGPILAAFNRDVASLVGESFDALYQVASKLPDPAGGLVEVNITGLPVINILELR